MAGRSRRRWRAFGAATVAVATSALPSGGGAWALAGAHVPAAPAIRFPGWLHQEPGFHGYAVAYEDSQSYTGVRGRFRDVVPTAWTDPSASEASCLNPQDVNSALWALMPSGDVLEVGFDLVACRTDHGYDSYEYVAIADHRDPTAPIIVPFGEGGRSLDAQPVSQLRYTARGHWHAYAIVREADARVWDLRIDGHLLKRWRSSRPESSDTLEAGIESYETRVRYRSTFRDLQVRYGGSWHVWQRQQTLLTRRMHASWGPDWTPGEN